MGFSSISIIYYISVVQIHWDYIYYIYIYTVGFSSVSIYYMSVIQIHWDCIYTHCGIQLSKFYILYICNTNPLRLYIYTVYIHCGIQFSKFIRDWRQENSNKEEQRVGFGSCKRAVDQTVGDWHGGKEAWTTPCGGEEAVLRPLNTAGWEKKGPISQTHRHGPVRGLGFLFWCVWMARRKASSHCLLKIGLFLQS